MTESQSIHASHALTPEGWRKDVRLTFSAGRIASVEADVAAKAGDDRQGIVIPALANLHSHAFQRAMAGLAERRHAGTDNFWSWRDLMYRLALSMTPDQVEAVAAQAYVEMLEAGYYAVGEFHYVHHDASGRPYSNIAEMASRMIAAGETTGIAVALLPVFYAHSKFGGAAPVETQRRFINSVDSYARLLEGCRGLAKNSRHVVGIAPHSLRAVTPDELTAVTAMVTDAPIHIHIAEQVKEVEDSVAWSGHRPVEWLLNHAKVDERWCLVHATHMTAAEIEGTARSRAVVGLCPITEANLGDGIFAGEAFMASKGRYGVGTDSNVQIGAAEELRMLEYSQRLERRARNVMTPPDGSTGRALFEAALQGGAQALGMRKDSGLRIGAGANVVALRADHVAFAGAREDAVLDAWIFNAGNGGVDSVWVAGRKVVSSGAHVKRAEVARRYAVVMKEFAAL